MKTLFGAFRKRLTALLALSFIGLATGCASNSVHPDDPLEPVNRATFAMNDFIDRNMLKPVAQGYKAVTPEFLRTRVSCFFGNISDLLTTGNSLLQAKPQKAATSFSRVLVNSSVGLLGLFDVATEAKIEKQEEDLGQTLGYWGISTGPYLVLPLMGPSTLRDAFGSFTEGYADPIRYVDSIPVRNSAYGLRILDKRTQLLGTENLLEQAALDKYTFVRGAYLQRRKNMVYDGKPPLSDE